MGEARKDHSVDAGADQYSTAEFISYLNQEIASIRSDLTQPGWTAWALVGSLAATIWLMLEQLETSSISVAGTLFLLLIFSLLMDGGTYLLSLMRSNDRDYSLPVRYRIGSHLFGENRIGLFLLLIRWLIPIFLALEFSDMVPWPITIAAIITSALFLIPTLLLALVSFMRIAVPVRIQPTRKVSTWLLLLLATLAFFALIGYLREIADLDPSITIADLRVALLIAVILFLTFLLVRSPSAKSILESLVNVRRNLMFGRIGLTDAIQQADIAISGSRLAELIQPELSQLVKLISGVSEHLTSASRQIGLIETLWADAEGKLDTDQQMIDDSLRRSVLVNLRGASRIMRQDIPEAQARLARRVALLKVLPPGAANPLQEVQDKISHALDESDARVDEAAERVMSLVRSTEGEEALKEYESELGSLENAS